MNKYEYSEKDNKVIVEVHGLVEPDTLKAVVKDLIGNMCYSIPLKTLKVLLEDAVDNYPEPEEIGGGCEDC